MYEVYVSVDQHNTVININSSAFIQNKEHWIKIDQGDTSVYARAQVEYFQEVYGKATFDENGYPNFRYEDGTIVALTKQEKEELYPKQTNTITTEGRIAMLEDAMQELILMQMGGE